MSHPLVTHVKRDPTAFYCGRPTIFGNPWVLGADGSRDEVIDRYETWLRTGRDFGHPEATEVRRQEILSRLPELRGKILSCWCAPNRCHGEVLATLAEATSE